MCVCWRRGELAILHIQRSTKLLQANYRRGLFLGCNIATEVSQAETAVSGECANAYDHLYKLVPYAAGDEFTLDLTELVTLVAANITKLTVKQQSGLRQAMQNHILGGTWTIAWPARGSGDSHGQMDLNLDVKKKQLPPQQVAPIQAAAPALQAAATVMLSVS